MFDNRLKALRKADKRRPTQQAMADLLGISRQGYAKYENGESQPDFETVKKLSEYFDVSIDYLITGNEHHKSEDAMWRKFLDPKTEIFFKDLQTAPDEKIEELIRFWEFIKERDK